MPKKLNNSTVMSQQSIQVSKEVTERGNTLTLAYETERGFLDATFNGATRWYGISNIGVERPYRRQGIGKAMLRHALVDAKLMGATLIYAGIISREGLVIMEQVFGEDAVQVRNQGTFTAENDLYDRHDANAALYYKIEE